MEGEFRETRMARTAAPFALVLALASWSACGQGDGRDPTTVWTTHDWTAQWAHMPHRLSVLELSAGTHPEGGALISGRMDGGPWGELDEVVLRQGVSVVTSRDLAMELGSVILEIPPGSQDFTAEQVVRMPVGSLAKAKSPVAVFRGLRLDSDEYENPPPFETDPDLPYDPAHGYTTGGLGVWLGEPAIEGGEVVLSARARNTLLTSDRADMNAAIPRATTWLRIDFAVLGTFSGAGQVATGEAETFISAAGYGQNTDHPRPPAEDQEIELDGSPGLDGAVFGLTGFDVWLNVEGQHDPACVVVQDEINSWDEPVSGPGRYVRELSARLLEPTYDPALGTGQVRLDVFLSNASEFKEVGNLCLGTYGQVAMLQYDDPDAARQTPDPAELRPASGADETERIGF